MFVDSCKRLRIMKGSEAIGLGMHLDLINYLIIITIYNIYSESKFVTKYCFHMFQKKKKKEELIMNEKVYD